MQRVERKRERKSERERQIKSGDEHAGLHVRTMFHGANNRLRIREQHGPALGTRWRWGARARAERAPTFIIQSSGFIIQIPQLGSERFLLFYTALFSLPCWMHSIYAFLSRRDRECATSVVGSSRLNLTQLNKGIEKYIDHSTQRKIRVK